MLMRWFPYALVCSIFLASADFFVIDRRDPEAARATILELVDWADANIHIASHVIHYGSGVFEGARCYDTARGPACFRLDAHIRRLYDSAKIYRMDYGLPRSEFQDAVLETIRANEFRACYIRPIIYRGYEALGVNPFPCPVDAAILLWTWGRYLGPEALELGVDVRVSSWTRSAPNTFPSLAKSSANYANSQLIKMEAIAEGYSEGIALDASGQVKSNEVFADSIGMFAESKLDPARVCKMIDNNWE